jgi:hypothetical protein
VNPANYVFLSSLGAPRCRVPSVFDARHRLPHRWKRSHIDVRPAGTAGAPCVESCSRSIDRCTGGSAIWRDLAAGDRVAIVRSAIAHNTNRTFRGRTGGDRLRTHHTLDPWEVPARGPVHRSCAAVKDTFQVYEPFGVRRYQKSSRASRNSHYPTYLRESKNRNFILILILIRNISSALTLNLWLKYNIVNRELRNDR